MSAPDGSKFKNTEARPNFARAAASASLLPGRATMCTFSKSSDRRHGNEVCPPSDQTHSSVRNKPKPGYFGGGSYIRQQLFHLLGSSYQCPRVRFAAGSISCI
ncbi:hypothetical protein KL909_003197 [Ogataea angusta]|nr:hypothetical protein KL909_003197 [Ogataea angusta]